MEKNDTFLRACRGEDVDYTPVWVMRQAGRYLPEYQKVRGRGSFLNLCKNPERCVEVTLQPIDIFDMDAAILFSDILIPVEAMGMALDFIEGRGPVFSSPIKTMADVNKLQLVSAEDSVPFVLETIKLLQRELTVPLIGFSGAPFTLSTYMIEGGSSKVFLETKKMMFQQPEVYHGLMKKITASTIDYLKAQVTAGVDALQIFDSWAGVLAPVDYQNFALPYVRDIITSLKCITDIPIIYFANNGSTLLELAATSGADVLGLDWRLPLEKAVARVGNHAVQGNLDPLALFLPEHDLKKRVKDIVMAGKKAKGHVFNLGHGVIPQTSPDKVKIMVDAVHGFGRR